MVNNALGQFEKTAKEAYQLVSHVTKGLKSDKFANPWKELLNEDTEEGQLMVIPAAGVKSRWWTQVEAMTQCSPNLDGLLAVCGEVRHSALPRTIESIITLITTKEEELTRQLDHIVPLGTLLCDFGRTCEGDGFLILKLDEMVEALKPKLTNTWIKNQLANSDDFDESICEKVIKVCLVDFFDSFSFHQ